MSDFSKKEHITAFAKSYAKLNLDLRVGKFDETRKLHEVESDFVLIDYYESLRFEIIFLNDEPGSFAFRTFPEEQNCRLPEDNLMFRAAKKWSEAIGVGLDVKVFHDDNVPTMRGFGIASSNAARMLRVLDDEYSNMIRIKFKSSCNSNQSDLTEDERKIISRRIAISLGSDVAFFFEGTSFAKVKGFGDVVIPYSSSLDQMYLIAIPPIAISTAKSFAMLYENGVKKFNRFSEIECYIEQRKWLEKQTGTAGWRLTGTGSAHFIANPKLKTIQKCKAEVERNGSNIRLILAGMPKELMPGTRLELA